jgi:hypothetical protein
MDSVKLNSRVTKKDVQKWMEDLLVRIELMTMDFNVPKEKQQ